MSWPTAAISTAEGTSWRCAGEAGKGLTQHVVRQQSLGTEEHALVVLLPHRSPCAAAAIQRDAAAVIVRLVWLGLVVRTF